MTSAKLLKDFDVEKHLDSLYVKIGKMPSKRTQNSFDFDIGTLGQAYTAAALMEIDAERPWRSLFEMKTRELFRYLGNAAYPHPGLLGGLSGLALLLRESKSDEADYANALTKLDNRLLMHGESMKKSLLTSIGANRFDYDYGIGLSGLVHYFSLEEDPSDQTSSFIDSACRTLEKLILQEGLWTSPADLYDEIFHQEPQAALGILDLGQAHGILGVTGVLAETIGVSEGVLHVQDFFRRLSEGMLISGIPYYLVGKTCVETDNDILSFDVPCGPVARNGWCYGLPMLEVLTTIWGLDFGDVFTSEFATDSMITPEIGGFDNPGLCHGIAGRIALNSIIGKPIPGEWLKHALSILEHDTKQGSDGSKSTAGFWDGSWGLIVVLTALSLKHPMPALFSVLGVRKNDRV